MENDQTQGQTSTGGNPAENNTPANNAENQNNAQNSSPGTNQENSNENTSGNDNKDKNEEIKQAEKRLDDKIKKLEELEKRVAVYGRSEVPKQQTKEEKTKEECNKFLEGTGLNI